MMLDRLPDVIRTVVLRDVSNWLRSPSKSGQWSWDSVRFRGA
jgi:hypothetical protein